MAMAQDFDGFGGDAKFCTPYSCPKDHEAVPKWSLTFVCPRNVAAWAGCKYFQVGMPWTTRNLNVAVVNCVMSIYKRVDRSKCCAIRHSWNVAKKCEYDSMDHEEQRERCDSSARIHELMIKMDACRKYNAEQYSHYDCVPNNLVPAKRGTCASGNELWVMQKRQIRIRNQQLKRHAMRVMPKILEMMNFGNGFGSDIQHQAFWGSIRFSCWDPILLNSIIRSGGIVMGHIMLAVGTQPSNSRRLWACSCDFLDDWSFSGSCHQLIYGKLSPSISWPWFLLTSGVYSV